MTTTPTDTFKATVNDSGEVLIEFINCPWQGWAVTWTAMDFDEEQDSIIIDWHVARRGEGVKDDSFDMDSLREYVEHAALAILSSAIEVYEHGDSKYG